jgi:hypothetical protein
MYMAKGRPDVVEENSNQLLSLPGEILVEIFQRLSTTRDRFSFFLATATNKELFPRLLVGLKFHKSDLTQLLRNPFLALPAANSAKEPLLSPAQAKDFPPVSLSLRERTKSQTVNRAEILNKHNIPWTNAETKIVVSKNHREKKAPSLKLLTQADASHFPNLQELRVDVSLEYDEIIALCEKGFGGKLKHLHIADRNDVLCLQAAKKNNTKVADALNHCTSFSVPFVLLAYLGEKHKSLFDALFLNLEKVHIDMGEMRCLDKQLEGRFFIQGWKDAGKSLTFSQTSQYKTRPIETEEVFTKINQLVASTQKEPTPAATRSPRSGDPQEQSHAERVNRGSDRPRSSSSPASLRREQQQEHQSPSSPRR